MIKIKITHPTPVYGNGKRSAYWDNVKGALIILVVVGHILWEYKSSPIAKALTFAIYTFHMPAFIFVSGYLSQGKSGAKAETNVKLLIWFLALNFAMMPYAYFVEHKKLSPLELYYSSWYLFALFLYRTTLPVIRRIPFAFTLSLVLAISAGYAHAAGNFLQLQKIAAFFPFFVLGATTTKENINTVVSWAKSHSTVFIATSAGAVMLVALLIHNGVIGYDQIVWTFYKSASDVFPRIVTLVMASLALAVLLGLTTDRPLPLISQWGRNSLSIYITHRIFTLLLALYFPALASEWQGAIALPAAAFIMIWILGSNMAAAITSRALEGLAKVLSPIFIYKNQSFKSSWAALIIGCIVGAGLIHLKIPSKMSKRVELALRKDRPAADVLHKTISPSQAAQLATSVSISFVGDLILLRDQVFKAWKPQTREYEYDEMFEYAAKYLKSADYSIGVLEGPLAGHTAEYSTSNFNDKIPLYLNYPDSFASSIKRAGIDFVTTANNHLLDRGPEGAERTRAVLDKIALAHSGSYSSPDDKAKRDIPVINVKGLKIAVLTYTYGSNNYAPEYFNDLPNRHLTSILLSPKHPDFENNKADIQRDLARARAKEPDTIIVLPHMGTQFAHAADEFQKTWSNIFVTGGADVVFTSHSHAVQPLEWTKSGRPGRKSALIVHSPGNFVNSYTAHDGDAMAIVTAHLDPLTGAPIASDIIPMWSQSKLKGSFRALPIFDTLHDDALSSELSTNDLSRISEVHSLITSVMMKTKLSLDQAQERYVIFPDGYVRKPISGLDVSTDLRSKAFYNFLHQSTTVTFIGDSVTEGTKNGGYGWYEPLLPNFPKLVAKKMAWGGYTTNMVLGKIDEILSSPTDAYVLAIGTNDVRYRDPKKSSMTKEEYVKNVRLLISSIREKNPRARFTLIAPWTTDHHDPVSKLLPIERRAMIQAYGNELEAMSRTDGHLFINANPGIEKTIQTEYVGNFLIDHIHPNANQGIRLYSQSVMQASP